jgi:hypothetical protein
MSSEGSPPKMANDLTPIGMMGGWLAAATILKPFLEKVFERRLRK